MTVTVVGMQLGDEGKGGIVDVYSENADVVVRYQGGDNAGHTVVRGDNEYKLSLVPSGAIRGRTGVLGNGCVVNPRTLFEEIDSLTSRGITPDVRLGYRAHVILPYHRVLDNIEESAKSDTDLEAGTTGRGIGPAYEDKVGRRGIRVGDLVNPTVLRERLEYVVPQKRAIVKEIFGREPGEAFDIDSLFSEYKEYGERIEANDMGINTGAYLAERLEQGDSVLFEGAQGTSIDIDHGIYPYVTSSNPSAGYAATGTGMGPTVIGQGDVIGVVKAYLSRVGTGPLPTELEGDLADEIREKGGEFGTVTGRPRRIGWLDLPMLRHAARVNGVTGVAINHVDVLAELGDVKVAESYELEGRTISTMPPTTELWGQCEPNYRSFDGWKSVDWSAVVADGIDALPGPAKAYLDFVGDELGTEIVAVGVGPDRDETIVITSPFE